MAGNKQKSDDPLLVQERTQDFNTWLRRQGEHMGYYQLPPQLISRVHDMIRKGYMAGARRERRRMEPVELGGVD